MNNKNTFYEWLDSSPFEWFANENESDETITVRFLINEEGYDNE